MSRLWVRVLNALGWHERWSLRFECLDCGCVGHVWCDSYVSLADAELAVPKMRSAMGKDLMCWSFPRRWCRP